MQPKSEKAELDDDDKAFLQKKKDEVSSCFLRRCRVAVFLQTVASLSERIPAAAQAAWCGA